MKRKRLSPSIFALMFASAAVFWSNATVQAAGGDWLVRAGAGQVDPKSNNHSVVGVKSDESLTLSGSYFFTDRIAVELLAAYPFTHVIMLNADRSEVGETRHLPPTLSLQYHFLPDAAFRPYIGAGLNYTAFFDEVTAGALAGTQLSLDDSVGFAAEVGVDIALSYDWAINLSIRWLDIDTRATLDDVDLGTVEIDPYVYSLMVARKFRF